MHQVRRAVTLATLSLAFACTASAAVVASDNFESYTLNAQLESGANGTPGTGLNGGTGFSGAYNVDDAFKSYLTVAGASLSYASGALSVNGGSQAFRLTGTSAVVNDMLSRPLASQTGTVYFSFLYRTNNPTGNEDFIQVGFSNASGEPKMSLGTSGKVADTGSSLFFARCPAGSGNVSWGTVDTQLLPDTTYFIVGKFSKVASSNYNRVELFLNPSTLTEPAALITKSGDTGMSSFNRFSLRTARLDGTDVYQIDNLIIGSTFADVVPEPASLALASLGLSALALRRRSAR